jgi:hypothetical protein
MPIRGVQSNFDDSRLSTWLVECESLTGPSKKREGDADPVEFVAYVRKEGKITVPKEVRDSMGIDRGDLVRCKIVRVKSH